MRSRPAASVPPAGARVSRRSALRRVVPREEDGSSAPPMRPAARRPYPRVMVMEAFVRDETGPVRFELDDLRGGWTLLAFFPPGMAADPELAAFERLRRRFADEDC